jgi:MFS family permease
MIAIPWYFTQIDELEKFGVVYALTNLAALIWVPYSGTLTDSYDRRKILIVVMAVLGLIILSIGWGGHLNGGLPWYMVATVFVLTFLNYNIHYPTLYAFVQEMTEAEHYGKITSFIEIQGQTATIVAGAGSALLLAGTVGEGLNILGFTISVFGEIEPWAINEIFLLDAATYFIGIFVLSLIKYRPLKKIQSKGIKIWKRIETGIDYLKANPYVMIFGLASYAVFVAVLIDGFYLMAPYVNNHLLEGADVYAAGEITYAFGAIMAGVFIRSIFKSVNLSDSIIIMSVMAVGLLFTIYATKSVLIFYLMGVILGMSNSGIRIQRVTYLFSKVPNEIYGRVNSVFNMANIVTRIGLISLFSLHFFQISNNIRYTFLILSVFVLIAVLTLLYHRKNILLDQR